MKQNNLKVIAEAVRGSRETESVIDSTVTGIASALWDSVSRWIDAGNLPIREKTFNLRDSIGCGVYSDGVLEKLFLFEPKGTAKKYMYHGMSLLADGYRLAYTTFMLRPYTRPGINIVFRCPLNYGFFLEHGLGPATLADGGDSSKAGFGWWSDELVPFIDKEFDRIAHGYISSK